VSHCDLAIYIKKYLKAKEEWWKFKYFTMQKYNLQINSLKETKILQDIIITLYNDIGCQTTISVYLLCLTGRNLQNNNNAESFIWSHILMNVHQWIVGWFLGNLMDHFPISTLAWVCSFDPTFCDECSPGVTMNHEFIFLANFREHFLFELLLVWSLNYT
jgi:hypothetical protein